MVLKVIHFINLKIKTYMKMNFNIFHILLFEQTLSTEVSIQWQRREGDHSRGFFCLSFMDLRLLEVAKFTWVMAGWQGAGA